MRTLSRGFLVVAGLLAQASTTDSASLKPLYFEEDPRAVRIREFFLHYGSPAHYLAEEFILAAEDNNLDWRLLPSIAFVESGGGKEYQRNNIFGWDNGRQRFPTIRQGIHTVASRLGNSELYRDKDLNGILRTYNTSDEYARIVLAVMESLGPAEIPAAERLN